MKVLLRIVVVLLLLCGAVYLYAVSLPANTTVTRSIAVQQTPEAIFALLSDFENMPKWNRNMEKIEILAPVHGQAATRQTFKGGMQMTIVTTEMLPPTHLVRTVADKSLPFAGSWVYAIKPTTAGGSEIALTEKSEISNPFYRLMVKIFDPTKFLDQHLEDIAKHFGETAVVK